MKIITILLYQERALIFQSYSSTKRIFRFELSSMALMEPAPPGHACMALKTVVAGQREHTGQKSEPQTNGSREDATYRNDLGLLQIPDSTGRINVFLDNAANLLSALAGVNHHTSPKLCVLAILGVFSENRAYLFSSLVKGPLKSRSAPVAHLHQQAFQLQSRAGFLPNASWDRN